MTLADILAVLDCINLTLMDEAKVMRMELSFCTTLIVNCCASKLVLWHAIAHNPFLLSNSLLLTRLAYLGHIVLVAEEGVIGIASRAVIYIALETEVEVRSFHGLRVANAGPLSLR